MNIRPARFAAYSTIRVVSVRDLTSTMTVTTVHSVHLPFVLDFDLYKTII
ncbi:MAG: hypothetical protein IKE03_08820 [Blautia sp.]|nr:hypothetical protein [Blautia sp.]